MEDFREFYWQKTEENTLWLQYCPECLRYIFYPRHLCPFCFSSALKWQPATGKGKLYSYTVVEVPGAGFDQKVPYIYAIVELDEGVRMAANLYNCSITQVEVNMPVKIGWERREDRNYPVFEPAKGESGE
ncbi:MAG: Zn-ribbon domain-containing OB-fold protein [Syntrophomonadaceae bacterium]|jgi:uncharacterized OB-fold protein